MLFFVGACPENAQIDVYTLYTHALVIEQIFRLNANVVQFCVNIRGDGVSGEPVVTGSPVNHGNRNANNQAEHLLSSQVQSSSEEGDRSSFGGAPSEKSRW